MEYGLFRCCNKTDDSINAIPCQQQQRDNHADTSLKLTVFVSLDYELFKEDALVFDDLKSDEVSICSRKSGKSVTLKAKDFPFWGIWTKPGAPFLCIEPWHGHADYEDFAGDLSEKDGIRKLRGGESFDAEYSFLVNNGT